MTSGQSHAVVYVFGPFHLRQGTMTLERNGRVEPLPPKAVETLLALVECAGELVCKEALLARIWPDTFVTESSLTRNISVVRKVLHDAGLPGAIETHARRGYRFALPVRCHTGEPLSRKPRDFPPVAWAAAALIPLLLLLPGSISRSEFSPNAEALREARIGRYLLDKVTPSDAVKALGHFQKAVLADPESAEAHAGLAAAYVLRAELQGKEAQPAYAAAKHHARRAIEMDPTHPAAHLAQGVSLLYGDWDWSGAERAYRRAIQIAPQDPAAYERLAHLLSRLGRHDEALKAVRQGIALDPASPRLGSRLASVLYLARRYSESAAECRQVLDRDSEYGLAHYYLGLSLAFLGEYSEALSHLQRSGLRDAVLRADSVWVQALAGQTPAIQGLEQPSSLMTVLALGKEDQALRLIQRWVEQRDSSALNLPSDPRLDSLRRHPEFALLVAKVCSGSIPLTATP